MTVSSNACWKVEPEPFSVAAASVVVLAVVFVVSLLPLELLELPQAAATRPKVAISATVHRTRGEIRVMVGVSSRVGNWRQCAESARSGIVGRPVGGGVASGWREGEHDVYSGQRGPANPAMTGARPRTPGQQVNERGMVVVRRRQCFPTGERATMIRSLPEFGDRVSIPAATGDEGRKTLQEELDEVRSDIIRLAALDDRGDRRGHAGVPRRRPRHGRVRGRGRRPRSTSSTTRSTTGCS